MRKLLIRFNNWLVKRKKFRFLPNSVLLLGPRCLQNSECTQNIVADPAQCQGCGRCDVCTLVNLADENGVRLAFVTGGGIAVKMLRQSEVTAVVAVACEAELSAGLLRRRRKPVLVIPIDRPFGPCKDTRVSLPEVEEALKFFL